MDTAIVSAVMTAIAAVSIMAIAVITKQRMALMSAELAQKKSFKTIDVLKPYTVGLSFPLPATKRLQPERFYSVDLTDCERADREEIMSFLNGMEYLALLINYHVIDEHLCKKFIRSLLVTSFKSLLSYILLVRKAGKNPRYFQEYEALARLWEMSNDQPAGSTRSHDRGAAA